LHLNYQELTSQCLLLFHQSLNNFYKIFNGLRLIMTRFSKVSIVNLKASIVNLL